MNPRGPRSIETDALRALRADVESPGADARARVASRLSASVLAIGGEGLALEGARQAAAGVATDGAARGLAVQAAQLVAPSVARTLGVTLVAFATGGAVGAAVHAEVSSTSPQIVYVDRVSTAPAKSTAGAHAPGLDSTRASEPQGEPPAASSSAERKQPPRTRSLVAPPHGSAGRDDAVSLAEQQALLDEARASLGKGENAAVLATLQQHAGQYPRSVLQEEREALAIKALVGAGQLAEARRRGALFQRRYPNSLLLPSVRAALEQKP
jgi:hypothetical protein